MIIKRNMIRHLLAWISFGLCANFTVRGDNAQGMVRTTTTSSLCNSPAQTFQPEGRIGEVIGNGNQDSPNQYQLTEFVRVQGAQPHPERHRVDTVFFTPVLKPIVEMLPSPYDGGGGGGGGEATSDSSDTSLVSLNTQDNDRISELCSYDRVGGSWRLKHRTNRGAHGEVWRGTRIKSGAAGKVQGAPEVVYVLKRMLLEKGEKVRLAAAREKYFGELMWDPKFEGHVARYVEVW
jgi:hypothetical protein